MPSSYEASGPQQTCILSLDNADDGGNFKYNKVFLNE